MGTTRTHVLALAVSVGTVTAKCIAGVSIRARCVVAGSSSFGGISECDVAVQSTPHYP
jgi:hypothetical protein